MTNAANMIVVKFGYKTAVVDSIKWDTYRKVADIRYTDNHGFECETTSQGAAQNEVRSAVAHALMIDAVRP